MTPGRNFGAHRGHEGQENRGWTWRVLLRSAGALIGAFGLTSFGTVAFAQSATAVPSNASANALFSARDSAADLAGPRIHGFFTKGCLARGEALPLDGPGWQVIRPSRNRYWGHPVALDFIKEISAQTQKAKGPALLIADIGQPRGGPMPFGHNSHQIGLDIDIWFKPAPAKPMTQEEREAVQEVSMIQFGALGSDINPQVFGTPQKELLRRAANMPGVARIFVHAGIKKALCEWETGDRTWLRRVRPWFGHDGHFHVRMLCPADEPNCREQEEIIWGEGCGSELTSWLRRPDPVITKRLEDPDAPPTLRYTALSALPPACRQILDAPALPAAR